jgi:hypothetical protein
LDVGPQYAKDLCGKNGIYMKSERGLKMSEAKFHAHLDESISSLLIFYSFATSADDMLAWNENSIRDKSP